MKLRNELEVHLSALNARASFRPGTIAGSQQHGIRRAIDQNLDSADVILSSSVRFHQFGLLLQDRDGKGDGATQAWRSKGHPSDIEAM